MAEVVPCIGFRPKPLVVRYLVFSPSRGLWAEIVPVESAWGWTDDRFYATRLTREEATTALAYLRTHGADDAQLEEEAR